MNLFLINPFGSKIVSGTRKVPCYALEQYQLFPRVFLGAAEFELKLTLHILFAHVSSTMSFF
jgi:hypothetical protein